MRHLLVVTLVLLLLAPSAPVEANPLLRFALRAFIGKSVRRAAVGGVARGLVRGSFRRLAAGGGRALIRSEVNAALRAAARRRVVVHRGRERMLRLFGDRTTYTIRGTIGRATGTAIVEGDVLVFRQGPLRLGFAQWESEGLVLYRANGLRVAQLVDEGERVIAYNGSGDYLGQFIREQIEDQITDIFIDALGQRHTELILPEPQPGMTIPETQRHYSYDPSGAASGFSTIRDGILHVYDVTGVELARGVMEENLLVVYDDEGEKQGWFEQRDQAIIAFDGEGKEMGRIITNGGQAAYYESGGETPQAWVTLGQEPPP